MYMNCSSINNKMILFQIFFEREDLQAPDARSVTFLLEQLIVEKDENNKRILIFFILDSITKRKSKRIF